MKNKVLLFAMLIYLIPASSVLAESLELEFVMPYSMMLPGSPFSLDLAADNVGQAMPDSQLFVALNVGTADYWFFPSWVKFPSDFDSAQVNIEADSSHTWPIISEFDWPAGAGEFAGAMFLGAVIYNNELVSNIAQFDFGWTEMPDAYEQISSNTDWVDCNITEVSKSVGFQLDGTAEGTYYIWWDESSSGSEECTANICVSAFYEDKTTAYFRDVDQGYEDPQVVVIDPDDSSVFIAVTSQDNTVGNFKIGVTFFPYSPDKSVNAREVTSWMTGDFDSYEQSQQQPTYYNITLRMKRIWPEKTDGYWLYVEQAVSGSTPYRQRVYRVIMASETKTGSEVYTFVNETDEHDAIGAWDLENPLSELTPDDFEQKEGCTVFLTKSDLVTFLGGTDGKGCATDLYGSTYTTSEVTLTPDQMRSWDRGFDDNDEQVWGAVDGPYIFDKQSNFDSELDL